MFGTAARFSNPRESSSKVERGEGLARRPQEERHHVDDLQWTDQACRRSDEMSTPVVLITGALTGIGRAAALAFAKGGSRVVISGRHNEAGQAQAMECARSVFVPADVRHEDAVRELVDQTVARFGRLDAAVNTAGTEGHPGPSPSSQPTATQPPSIPMCSAPCSA